MVAYGMNHVNNQAWLRLYPAMVRGANTPAPRKANLRVPVGDRPFGSNPKMAFVRIVHDTTPKATTRRHWVLIAGRSCYPVHLRLEAFEAGATDPEECARSEFCVVGVAIATAFLVRLFPLWKTLPVITHAREA